MIIEAAFEPRWGSRMSKNWQNMSGTWDQFVKNLSQTYRTPETYHEYKTGPVENKDLAKDKGGFVGGTVADGLRRKHTIIKRTMVTLDIDHGGKYQGDIRELLASKLSDILYVYYTTHSHSPESPRIRVVVPFSRDVTPEEYEPLARMLAKWIDDSMDIWDNTTYQASRLMFLPSTSVDGEFYCGNNLGTNAQPLNVDAVLNLYNDFTNPEEWPVAPDENRATVKRFLSSADYNDSELPYNLRNFFNVNYPMRDVINEWLYDVYQESYRNGNRFTFTGGTVADGVQLYDDGKTYHMNESDPCHGMSCDPYTIIKINLCSDDDEEMLEWLIDNDVYENYIRDVKSWF